ncbi:hypothetical protein PIB30_094337 [Stylosanthes scabra]|uniref:Uncharacterized protein n=1 Tax=Stylosanthes scabra TaxID=79078 RepID=A0ABU6ZU10_9FABA|nr:hypothetical protein [Stylosanthes scabra]
MAVVAKSVQAIMLFLKDCTARIPCFGVIIQTHLPPPPSPTVLRCRGDGCRGGSPNSPNRRAHSEVSFKLPEDMMDLSPSDPFAGGSSTNSLKEIGFEDNLFFTYIDVEKLSSGGGASNGSVHTGTSGNKEEDESLGGSGNGGTEGARPRHRHRNRRHYFLICWRVSPFLRQCRSVRGG